MICERAKNHKDKRLNDQKWDKSRKKSIDEMIGTPITHAKDPTLTIPATTNAVEGFFFKLCPETTFCLFCCYLCGICHGDPQIFKFFLFQCILCVKKFWLSSGDGARPLITTPFMLSPQPIVNQTNVCNILIERDKCLNAIPNCSVAPIAAMVKMWRRWQGTLFPWLTCSVWVY